MKSSALILLSLLALLVLFRLPGSSAGWSKKNTKPEKKKEVKKAPKILIDYDRLPGIVEVLEGLEMSSYLPIFIKQGITETRHLIQLKDMDFRIMQLDHKVADNHIKAIKEKIKELIAAYTIDEKPVRVDIEERKKLKYGRLYMTHAVQSFEYITATFGSPPPMGAKPLLLPSDVGLEVNDGCSLPADLDLTGYVFAIMRGNCTFLTKALAVHAAHGTELIIVNSEDNIEAPSSGLGIDPAVQESVVTQLNGMSIVSTANTSWSKLQEASKRYPPKSSPTPTTIDIVPLKCASGGVCAALTPEEKALVSEIYWATISLTVVSDGGDTISTKQYEAITSNFGSRLPLAKDSGSLAVRIAEPLDACEPLVPPANAAKPEGYYEGAIVLAYRGSCRFDTKARQVQDAGGRVLLVVDPADSAMQRVGGQQPAGGYVGIPSLMAALPAGEFIHQAVQTGHHVTATLSAGSGTAVMDDWIDLAFTQWAENDDELLIQIEGLAQKYSHSKHTEVVDWLRRKEDAIKTKLLKAGHSGEL